MADPAERFRRFADAYATSRGHAHGEELGRLLEMAAPEADWRALDVATGAGHTALLFAPYVAQVMALDPAPEMLAKARTLAAGRDITNLRTIQGRAEELPFPDESFQLVTCRIAPHHFSDCRVFVREAARVLVDDGLLVVQDHVLPEDRRTAVEVDHFERLRDPSHVRAFSETEWLEMVRAAGLQPRQPEIIHKRHDFADWTARQDCTEEVVRELVATMARGSTAMRSWMEPEHWGEPDASFVGRHLIIAARK